MSHLLLYYQRPEPATWVFLSSFLLLGIYFVFHRFFCVRNLDIVLLLLLAPGLMMVYEGRRMDRATDTAVNSPELARVLTGTGRPGFEGSGRGSCAWQGDSLRGSAGKLVAAPLDANSDSDSRFIPEAVSSANHLARFLQSGEVVQRDAATDYAVAAPPPKWTGEQLEFYGFLALLSACSLLLIRMCIDPAFVRRPLLVPNLSIGGLNFIGISLFLFLMANVVTSSPREQDLRGPDLGPGYALLNTLPQLPTMPSESPNAWKEATSDAAENEERPWLPKLARALAILSNLAIVFGIVGVGYWHFDNVKTGIGCAVMYLLLPYTAQMTGNLEHVMPAAFLVLALLTYRQPLLAGGFMGIAAGLVYYPLFLLPLWISFYWKRGLGRLLTGVITALVVLAGLLLLRGWDAFDEDVRWMFGLWSPRMEGMEGIWGPNGFPPAFRLPVLVGFILLSVSFVFWPSRKNLGSLMCGTAAVMLAAQFWHGNGGGLFMAWFLPFTLLTVFRPNLDDRIATAVVRQPTQRVEA